MSIETVSNMQYIAMIISIKMFKTPFMNKTRDAGCEAGERG